MKVLINSSTPASTPTAEHRPQYFSSYVVNKSIAIDAGALGLSGTIEEQSNIRHVFLTHCHLDHIASLPVFLENAYDPERETVAAYGHPAALADIQKHLFNDLIWPDFVRLPTPRHPLVKLCPIKPESPIQVNGLTVTPVLVDHIVATYGYVVTDGSSTVVFGGDSRPTSRIWEVAKLAPEPISVFLEASFPDALAKLAHDSAHLTPGLFGAEIGKMPEIRKLLAIHIKPRFYEETVRELRQLNLPKLEIGLPGFEYDL
ncbi:MAG TPA: 3',5'-cyclic-nucleotide phosphodiesterase [Bryobacteraceae bacterium]|nr:3',5'-cyclic-nucleotide phosphodiesterase [Bryobacteraceae bacterium]